MDAELYVTEDEKAFSECLRTMENLVAKNNWPVVLLVLMDDKAGSIVASSFTNLRPEHKESCVQVPQVGAAIFHATNIVSNGLAGTLPESMVQNMLDAKVPDSTLTETYPQEGG